MPACVHNEVEFDCILLDSNKFFIYCRFVFFIYMVEYVQRPTIFLLAINVYYVNRAFEALQKNSKEKW